MIQTFICCFYFFIGCLGCASESETTQSYETKVRQPAAAGQFYSNDPVKLENTIASYLADAVTPFTDRPIAIISPHAGHIYSGQICADAFKQAAAHDYDLVVLLGTNHTTAGFRGVSIIPGGGYKTPLGTAVIDEGIASELIAADKDFTFNESVHSREHSVEVIVPFVQYLFPKAKIVPTIIGAPDLDLCTRFGETLAKVLEGRRALIVASSDLSHYPDYQGALDADQNTTKAIMELNPEAFRSAIRKQLNKGIPDLSTCACGQAPILTAIVAAKKLGASGAQIISYANSGDAAVGKRTRVVGYAAAALVKGPESSNAAVFGYSKTPARDKTAFTREQKAALLSFARKTIRQLLTTDTTPLARGFEPILEQEKGAFVTLKKHGALRGCIGHMAEDLPLCHVVGYCALQAAFNDRRFPQVSLQELEDIEIEISVLTPFEQVGGVEDILIGRDGVLLEKSGRSAVYLPSVAVEQGWDRDEMLNHLCAKAGLSSDCWKKGAKFYTFQSIVFSESELH